MPKPSLSATARSFNPQDFFGEAFELIRDLRDALLRSEARVRELEALLFAEKGGSC